MYTWYNGQRYDMRQVETIIDSILTELADGFNMLFTALAA